VQASNMETKTAAIRRVDPAFEVITTPWRLFPDVL